MNISSVSFKSSSFDNYELKNYQNTYYGRQNSLERTPAYDSYDRRSSYGHTNTRRPNNKKQGSGKVKPFLAGAALAMAINLGVSAMPTAPEAQKMITITNDHNMSITQIAELYDSDYDAILDANGFETVADFNKAQKIKIPAQYDYIGHQIEELQNSLYKKSLSKEKRREITNEIKRLQEKQQYQNEIAALYTDGRYAYIQIREFDENTPEEIRNRFPYNSINVETLKSIFDIKDEYIKKYNNIPAKWENSEPDPNGHRGYFSYSYAHIEPSQTIKVPLSAIDRNNINFNYK